MNVRRLVWLVAVKIETIRARSQHGWHCEFAFYSLPHGGRDDPDRSPTEPQPDVPSLKGLGFHYYTYPALSPKRRQVTPTDARAASAPIKAAPFGDPVSHWAKLFRHAGRDWFVDTSAGSDSSHYVSAAGEPQIAFGFGSGQAFDSGWRKATPSTATAALVGDRGRQREPPLRMTDHKLMGQIGPLA